MIQSVTVTNFLNESLVISLSNPDKSNLAIVDITGIGPAKADILTTEIVTGDGAIFNSSRILSRNIVMTLRYYQTPGIDIETIRQMTYKYFPIKQQLGLKFKTTNRTATISGYVESNEPNIFSPESGTQISIICPNPNFLSDEINTTIFFGVEDMFEFPFSNESLTESLLVMGDIINATEQSVIYEGDGEIGVMIFLFAIGEVNDITITNARTRDVMFISTSRLKALTGYGIIAGDEIRINTVRGDKSITLIRKGKSINILNVLGRNTAWFQLAKGDNLFVFTAESGAVNLKFRIENQIIYGGV